MSQQIVVAVDGSEASEAALQQAIQLARQRQMALTGIFVIDGNWPDFIGNDWQSAKGARQGFLDYIRDEQLAQAQAAKEQFAQATAQLPDASFQVVAGDPARLLTEIACGPETGMLVASKRVFQVCGRPSLKALAGTLAKRATQPLLLIPRHLGAEKTPVLHSPPRPLNRVELRNRLKYQRIYPARVIFVLPSPFSTKPCL